MRVWLMLFLFVMDCLLIWVERLNRINLRSTEICWLSQQVQKYYRDQWRIQGRGPGGLPPSLFLDQNEEGPKKIFFEAGALSYLRVWITAPPTPPPPPYLKVWINHWRLETNTKVLSLRHCLTLILGQGLWRTTSILFDVPFPLHKNSNKCSYRYRHNLRMS